MVEIVRVYFKDLTGNLQYLDFPSKEKAKEFASTVKIEKAKKLTYNGERLKLSPISLV